MPHINPIPDTNQGPAAPILADLKQQMGSVPNIFATMAHSPAVLEGFLSFNGALAGGVLTPQLREQIALAVAGKNRCDYCASAHTLLAKGAGVDSTEAAANLQGESSDPRTNAILGFARTVVDQKGVIDSQNLSALKEFGVSDTEIVEIVAHVGINIFTNYFNHVAQTEVDFPFVAA